jgi:hypothetical protein
MLIDVTERTLRTDLREYLVGEGFSCITARPGFAVRSPRARTAREDRLEITAALSAWHRRAPAAELLVLDPAA